VIHITSYDASENTDKWKLWKECIANYLKRREKEENILEKIKID